MAQTEHATIQSGLRQQTIYHAMTRPMIALAVGAMIFVSRIIFVFKSETSKGSQEAAVPTNRGLAPVVPIFAQTVSDVSGWFSAYCLDIPSAETD